MYAYCQNNPVMFVDPSGEFAITLTTILVAGLIGASTIGTISGVISYSKGERGWDLVGDIAGGAIAGFGIGVATVLGAVAGTAALVGSSATLFSASGMSVTFGSALLIGTTTSFITGISGYAIKTAIKPSEDFDFRNMLIEGGINSISGGLSVCGGYLSGLTGFRANLVSRLLVRKSDVFIKPIVENYFTFGIKLGLGFLKSGLKYD